MVNLLIGEAVAVAVSVSCKHNHHCSEIDLPN